MLAEDLITLATASGIDLSRVGGNASDTRGEAARRKRTALERRLGIEVIESATGRGSRTVRPRYWSVAELGMACKRGEENPPHVDLPYLAMLFHVAGDNSGLTYWQLWWALRYRAGRSAQREGWRPMVTGRAPRDQRTGKPVLGTAGEPHFYLDELAQLVLDEDRHRSMFNDIPGLHAAYMNVDEPIWERVLEPRFAGLKGQLERWCAIGISRVRGWLLEDTPEVSNG